MIAYHVCTYVEGGGNSEGVNLLPGLKSMKNKNSNAAITLDGVAARSSQFDRLIRIKWRD